MPSTALIYARLSQAERPDKQGDVTSLESQIAQCQNLAKHEGYSVVEAPFVDDGISAWKGKLRPSFVALVERVERGGVDVILAVEDSRLTRSTEESLLLQGACARMGTRWHTVARGIHQSRRC